MAHSVSEAGTLEARQDALIFFGGGRRPCLSLGGEGGEGPVCLFGVGERPVCLFSWGWGRRSHTNNL